MYSIYYTINERQILSSFAQHEDCADTVKALMILREFSSAPRQLVYGDNTYHSNFMLKEQTEKIRDDNANSPNASNGYAIVCGAEYYRKK